LDVVDQSRALIEGLPKSGVPRTTWPLRQLSITPVAADIPRAIRSRTLVKLLAGGKKEEKKGEKKVEKKGDKKVEVKAAASVLEQVARLGWSKKLQRTEIRKNLNDFQRFKLLTLRKKKSRIVNVELSKLRKAAPAKKAKGAKKEKKSK